MFSEEQPNISKRELQPSVLDPLAARLRFLGISTGLLLMAAWAANFAPWNDLLDQQGTPLGGDFPMFYLGGQIAAAGDVDRLYNMNEHQQRLRILFPSLGKQDLLPYRYPPFVAGATSPLAHLPYGWAWGCFALFSLGLAAFSWKGLLQIQLAETSVMQAAAIALCGWPVAVEVIIGGQASFLALAIAVGSILLLTRHQEAAAGAVLACALYKPNVLLLFAVGCLLRYPRMLLGFIPIAALLGLLSVATVGWDGCWEYVHLGKSLVNTSWDIPTPFWKIHGLISWLDFWLPGWGRPMVVAGGTLAVVAWVWKSYRQGPANGAKNPSQQTKELALLILINTLCNPYPPIYDLVLLAIPAWLALHLCEQGCRLSVAKHGRKIAVRWQIAVAAAAAVFFFGPHFSQSLSWQLHGQLFTVVLVLWCAWQWRQTFVLEKTAVPIAETKTPVETISFASESLKELPQHVVGI